MKKEAFVERMKLIEEEIAKVNAQINQLVANLNVLQGGKQEAMYWIAFCDLPTVEDVLGPGELVKMGCTKDGCTCHSEKNQA